MTDEPKTGTEWLMQQRDREHAERVMAALVRLSEVTGIPVATIKRALGKAMMEQLAPLMKDFPHD
jgi:hypothetical protein